MSGADRTPWETSTVLDQAFLDACADNLNCSLEMVAEIELPGGGTIYVSDRNKYVGERFYEALVKFPSIDRTIGEWLSNETEFSTLTLNLSNVDGRFNSYLPSGANFGGWVGKQVEVKLGLRDVASTYRTIFRGLITDIGGFGRTTQTVVIIARDEFDKLATQFPQVAFGKVAYPSIENDKEGLVIPFILGDWTTGLTQPASVPAFVVNGADPNVYGGLRTRVQCRISINSLSLFDSAHVYLRRGNNMFLISSSDITSVNVDKNYFEIVQGGATTVDGAPYLYETGDEFFTRVQGPLLSGFRDNAVEQAKHVIETYLPGLVTFGSSWATFRAKAAPSQSAIAAIKSRVWVQEPQSIIAFAKSLLQQVRLEAFFDSSLQLSIASMQFEDFVATPTFSIKNWDVEKDTFQTAVDERNVFNRAQAAFNFEPVVAENSQQTGFWKSVSSVTQLGREISKKIVFPNLYVQSDVEAQLVEILRLACGCPENISFTATWRSLLKDLADFFALDVRIGPAMFSKVPCRIRSIGYEPAGLKLNVKATSFQMIPFGSWNPGYAGTTGGQSATITQE